MTEELSEVLIDDIIGTKKKIIIYDDDVNTFEHVENCLISYLAHSAEQAHQCALMIHNNGKCAVKNGYPEELAPLCEILIAQSLKAKIE